jgi:hypothetical protein
MKNSKTPQEHNKASPVTLPHNAAQKPPVKEWLTILDRIEIDISLRSILVNLRLFLPRLKNK